MFSESFSSELVISHRNAPFIFLVLEFKGLVFTFQRGFTVFKFDHKYLFNERLVIKRLSEGGFNGVTLFFEKHLWIFHYLSVKTGVR